MGWKTVTGLLLGAQLVSDIHHAAKAVEREAVARSTPSVRVETHTVMPTAIDHHTEPYRSYGEMPTALRPHPTQPRYSKPAAPRKEVEVSVKIPGAGTYSANVPVNNFRHALPSDIEDELRVARISVDRIRELNELAMKNGFTFDESESDAKTTLLDCPHLYWYGYGLRLRLKIDGSLVELRVQDAAERKLAEARGVLNPYLGSVSMGYPTYYTYDRIIRGTIDAVFGQIRDILR